MDVYFNKKQWIYLSCVGFLLMTGCAHIRPSSPLESRESQPTSPKTLTEVLEQDMNHPSHSSATSSPSLLGNGVSDAIIMQNNGDIIVRGIKLKNTHFDIPITVNSRVEYWVDYFCGRGRGYFEKYLQRSEFFVPYIEPLLKQNGLPADLVYLAMIESGFNNLARSRARAVGPWQFISATGKRYGLMVNWWVDERRDIRKSTLAAVEYLRDLYNLFQSWELAAAAYNAGEAKIARAVRRYGTKDFWVLSRQRFLRPETRDYVPKIIAAALISKNRVQFGFPDQAVRAGAGEAVAGDGEIVKVVKTDKPLGDKAADDKSDDKESQKQKQGDSFASAADSIDFDEDEDDNSDDSTQQISPATLTVPVENHNAGTQLASHSASHSEAPHPPLAKPIPTPHLTKSGEVGGEELMEFEIQSPADLLKIARAAGLSYQTVKSLNPEVLRWCTPPKVGTFRIKLPVSVKDRFLTTYNHEAFPRKVQFMTYRVNVKRGESVSKIARHFGIKVDPISELNGISPRMSLRYGSKILLPLPNDRSRTFTSLEVRDPPERRRGHRHHSHHRYYRISYKHRAAARSLGKATNSSEDEG